MKGTVVGLVTPHILAIIDLAKQAEMGANVDWHLRDTVARSIDGLGHQFNAQDLITAYIQGLETTAEAARPAQKAYADALRAAAAMATRALKNFE